MIVKAETVDDRSIEVHEAIFSTRRYWDAAWKAALEKCKCRLAECATCLGNKRIRDAETGDLRRCLDCGGAGVR